MINLGTAREGLATVIRDRVTRVTVYPRAIDGTPAVPAVVIGQPEVDLDSGLPCMDVITFPVAVIVRRDGTDEDAVAQDLDDLLVEVVEALREGIDSAPMDQVGAVRVVKRARPGALTVQGTEFPASLIEIEING